MPRPAPRSNLARPPCTRAHYAGHCPTSCGVAGPETPPRTPGDLRRSWRGHPRIPGGSTSHTRTRMHCYPILHERGCLRVSCCEEGKNCEEGKYLVLLRRGHTLLRPIGLCGSKTHRHLSKARATMAWAASRREDQMRRWRRGLSVTTSGRGLRRRRDCHAPSSAISTCRRTDVSAAASGLDQVSTRGCLASLALLTQRPTHCRVRSCALLGPWRPQRRGSRSGRELGVLTPRTS